MIEAARRGDNGDIMSLLWKGPRMAQSIRPRSTNELDDLIPSMILGYVVPTLLMAIPFPSLVLHQWLGGFWQGYPVWVTPIQYGIGFCSFQSFKWRSDVSDRNLKAVPNSVLGPCSQYLDFPKRLSSATILVMAIGILNFSHHDQYVGSTAAIVWAATLWVKVCKQGMSLKKWLWLVGKIFRISIVAGPGAAVVSLIWNRDELILHEDRVSL
ncbi:hypothetical protein B0J14DRAFT_635823 [Halenospora varia]|nr:hypothetical protein B0J14DRAFT_635823 [Halenospora varia]